MKKLIIGTLLCLLGHSGFAADDVSDLVTKVKPAVVAIEIFDANSKLLGTATGWLYNTGSSVEVVTNAHVVANCERIRMTTMGGINVRFDRWDGYDEIADIGLIRARPDPALTPLCLATADTSSVREGQAITVIGDPLGVTGVVSNGIISAIRPDELQIDAPISSGSSGSPVVNRNGEVVAMVKGTFTDGQNMNFCVRVDSIKDAVLAAYMGTPLNRHSTKVAQAPQVTTTAVRDSTTITAEIKDFIGGFLRDCGDGSSTYLEKYLESQGLYQWYDQKKPSVAQVIASVDKYGAHWRNQSVLWDASAFKCTRLQDDKFEMYAVTVPIKWTANNVKTGKLTTVYTYFCSVVYRHPLGDYSIIAAWNDKHGQYQT